MSSTVQDTVEPAIQLTVERVPVDSLELDDMNPRRHSEANLRAIERSLQNFGQQKPIVIDQANRVIAGNGTLLAARRLGWNEIAVVRSRLRGPRARAFAVGDNRTAELAEWDHPVLAEILRSVRDAELNDIGHDDGAAGDDAFDPTEVLHATGFSDREVDGLLRSTLDATAAPVDRIDDEWLIIVTCESESEQRTLLERFTREGLSCRAVM